MQVRRVPDNVKVESNDYLDFRCRAKIKVVHNGPCMSANDEKCMPLGYRTVGENTTQVLRDKDCSGIIA